MMGFLHRDSPYFAIHETPIFCTPGSFRPDGGIGGFCRLRHTQEIRLRR